MKSKCGWVVFIIEPNPSEYPAAVSPGSFMPDTKTIRAGSSSRLPARSVATPDKSPVAVYWVNAAEPVFNLANNSKSGLTYNSKSSFILELKLILSSIGAEKLPGLKGLFEEVSELYVV